MEVSLKMVGAKEVKLKPHGRQISQDEFMRRWGQCSWPNQEVNSVKPESGYFAGGKELLVYSGVKDWFRPALWYEWIILLTWGRLFWFKGKRWAVYVDDHRSWGLHRMYRTRLSAYLSCCLYILRAYPVGTLYFPGRKFALYDQLTGKAHREWLP